jgi:hypothetical protein
MMRPGFRKAAPHLLSGSLHVVRDLDQVRFIPQEQAAVAIQVRFEAGCVNSSAATDCYFVSPLHQCGRVLE